MDIQITKKQFDVLCALAESKASVSQRQLEIITGHSLGTVNKIIKTFNELGYVENGAITQLGLNALEPFKAKRAVFIAAGFGSRLVPVTLNTPKPLVRVNGKRIIDGLIDAVYAAGIDEIYIVRGYLADQFDQLLYKYPNIKFLENPMYNEANNISSSMIARYFLSNSYVFEADLLISNPKIIKKYHYSSEFLGIKVDRSDDWCFTVKDGYIKEEKVGGQNCYQMVGISYWNESDSKKLSKHIEEAFQSPGGKELYWEQVPLLKFKDEYKVGIAECQMDDIVEIDTFIELVQIDKSYEIK